MATTIQWENRNEAKWMKKIKVFFLFRSLVRSLFSFSVVRWARELPSLMPEILEYVFYVCVMGVRHRRPISALGTGALECDG